MNNLRQLMGRVEIGPGADLLQAAGARCRSGALAAKGILLAGMLALAGCGTAPSTIVSQPTTARPQPQPPQTAANGAIYQVAAYRPLFEDRRARHVGDVLTIVISEKTQAGKQASSNASKTNSVDASISPATGLPLKVLPGIGLGTGLTLGAETAIEYDDASKLDSSNTFSGSVTVSVIEVLANGNLVVAGEKQIGLDKGTEYIRLSGVVQPDTIQAGNTVPSAKVADARIEYRTSAKFDRAEMMNWLGRFFLSFIPL